MKVIIIQGKTEATFFRVEHLVVQRRRSLGGAKDEFFIHTDFSH